MNSLYRKCTVPSYYLVKYSILNQLITHQCQDKPVAALLNIVRKCLLFHHHHNKSSQLPRIYPMVFNQCVMNRSVVVVNMCIWLILSSLVTSSHLQ